MVHLPDLFEKYSDRAEFLFIYAGERGMTMGTHDHQLPEALSALAEPPDAPPGSRLLLEQRVRAGKKHFHLPVPCLIDTEESEVQSLYAANPKRLIIVDPAGRIALDSGRVPSAPFPWKEVSNWLDHYGESLSPQSTLKQG